MSTDYPTPEELRELEDADNAHTLREILELAIELWGECGVIRKRGNTVVFITGGWSGNEDIINALGKNFMFWSSCWCASYAGGKHIFHLPKQLADVRIRKPETEVRK